jgi:hypothetical protein
VSLHFSASSPGCAHTRSAVGARRRTRWTPKASSYASSIWAGDLGWKVKWAQEVWRRGEHYRLFLRVNQFPSRLYLSGKVIRLINNLESNGCTAPSRCTTASSSLVLPGYIERQIAKWEPDRRAVFLGRLKRTKQRAFELQRDAMAAVREIMDQDERRLFAEFGLHKTPSTKSRDPLKIKLVRVLVAEEDQASAATGVSSTGASSKVVQQPNPVAQTPTETVVQDATHRKVPETVQRSEAALQPSQIVAQLIAHEAIEATKRSPPLNALEIIRAQTDPSSAPYHRDAFSTTTKAVENGTAPAKPEIPVNGPAFPQQECQEKTGQGRAKRDPGGSVSSSSFPSETTVAPDVLTYTPPPQNAVETVAGHGSGAVATVASESACMSDQEFERSLICAFFGAGKDSPTHQQALDVMAALPVHSRARLELLLHLKGQVARLKHPGSLPTVVAGFKLGWPALIEASKRRESRESAPTPSFGPDEIPACLLYCSQQLREKPEFAQIALELENRSTVGGQGQAPLEALEAALQNLDARMLAIARALAGAGGQLLEIEARLVADPELAKYKCLTTHKQLEDINNQSLNRKLAEEFGLPRLSLSAIS